MKNGIILYALIATLFSTLNAETINLDKKMINFGQKIFKHKLQKQCGYTASHWANKHTKEEWDTIQSTGVFKENILEMCPKSTVVLKDEWLKPLYFFAKEYAKDTMTFPNC